MHKAREDEAPEARRRLNGLRYIKARAVPNEPKLKGRERADSHIQGVARGGMSRENVT